MKILKVIALVSCSCFFFFHSTNAQVEARLMPHYYKKFDEVVKKCLHSTDNKGKIRGMAIGIVSNGKISHIGTYGYADVEEEAQKKKGLFYRQPTNYLLFKKEKVFPIPTSKGFAEKNQNPLA